MYQPGMYGEIPTLTLPLVRGGNDWAQTGDIGYRGVQGEVVKTILLNLFPVITNTSV
jgi:hypothetical protein